MFHIFFLKTITFSDIQSVTLCWRNCLADKKLLVAWHLHSTQNNFDIKLLDQLSGTFTYVLSSKYEAIKHRTRTTVRFTIAVSIRTYYTSLLAALRPTKPLHKAYREVFPEGKTAGAWSKKLYPLPQLGISGTKPPLSHFFMARRETILHLFRYYKRTVHCAVNRTVSVSNPSGVSAGFFRSYRRNHVPWGRLSL
jgi:hypothetical protein